MSTQTHSITIEYTKTIITKILYKGSRDLLSNQDEEKLSTIISYVVVMLEYPFHFAHFVYYSL
jgi:hypothetical protein